jgi:hypothetical protein
MIFWGWVLAEQFTHSPIAATRPHYRGAIGVLMADIHILAAFAQQKLIQLRKHLFLLYSGIGTKGGPAFGNVQKAGLEWRHIESFRLPISCALI